MSVFKSDTSKLLYDPFSIPLVSFLQTITRSFQLVTEQALSSRRHYVPNLFMPFNFSRQQVLEGNVFLAISPFSYSNRGSMLLISQNVMVWLISMPLHLIATTTLMGDGNFLFSTSFTMNLSRMILISLTSWFRKLTRWKTIILRLHYWKIPDFIVWRRLWSTSFTHVYRHLAWGQDRLSASWSLLSISNRLSHYACSRVANYEWEV